MKVYQKRPFTLLEVLVVLFLLSLVAALTGIQLKNVYQEQRFLSEYQQVLSHAEMAQDLMLILDTDVKLKIVQYQDKRVEYWIDVDKPLVIKSKKTVSSSDPKDKEEEEIVIDREASIRWSHLVERRIPLQAIRSFKFESTQNQDEREEEKEQGALHVATLEFSLGKMSRGTLTLCNYDAQDVSQQKNKGKERHIYLQGYPCLIRKQPELAKWENLQQESQMLRPKEKKS